MIVEDIVQPSSLRASARQAPLGPHIDDILAAMGTVGYKARSIRQLMQGLIRFGEYLRSQGIVDLNQLRFDHVESFIVSQPFRLFRGRYRIRNSCVWAANYLWRYTCAAGITAPNKQPPAPVYSPLLEEWLEFLERHRGLAPGSLKHYRRHIHRFLQSLASHSTKSGLAQVDGDYIREYVDHACRGCSRSVRKAILSTLRNFLRFAWSRGHTSRDLSLFVGRMPTFNHDRVPRGPTWEDAKRLLDAPDRTTPVGRRDYAILQLLLTYGVRGQQICSLSIEDICWQRDTITFAPLKGDRGIEVPLMPAVGEAILSYLRYGRPHTNSRRIFLCSQPPFTPLLSISSLVVRAFEKAGVPSPHHGSHALRHAWATRMLAEGRPLKTIADLIGHRSIETTRIYTKVDFAHLRTVPLPWPEEVQ